MADKSPTKSTKSGFSAEERDAMKARAKEAKASASLAEAAAAFDAAVKEMEPGDRRIAQRLAALVKENAPALTTKTWYGQPAWAAPTGEVVCFFQARAKFKTRYATFGFNEAAKLDDGGMWSVAWAIDDFSAADEKTLAAVIKKAAG